MSKAKKLKKVLRENGHPISHGRSTHVYARMIGYRDWNELTDRQYAVLQVLSITIATSKSSTPGDACKSRC
jgi:hypothetical protein